VKPLGGSRSRLLDLSRRLPSPNWQTRLADGTVMGPAEEFLALAARIPVSTTIEPYGLAEANVALANLRDGRVKGAAVLIPGH